MLRRTNRRAFTLIELLLVLVILAVLAGVAVPIYIGQAEKAKINATRASINMIKQALNTFEVDHDRFPSSDEGLDALVHQPGDMTEWHPYLEKIPTDAWTRTFEYRCPSTTGAPFYDLYSFGPDGQDGTPDDIYEDK